MALRRVPYTTDICVYAGIFCKTWSVPEADALIPQHAHSHPHITLLVSGAVRLFRGGAAGRMEVAGEYRAPAMIKIPAKQFHHFLTLAPDTTLACIHASRLIDGEPEIEAENTVWTEG